MKRLTLMIVLLILLIASAIASYLQRLKCTGHKKVESSIRKQDQQAAAIETQKDAPVLQDNQPILGNAKPETTQEVKLIAEHGISPPMTSEIRDAQFEENKSSLVQEAEEVEKEITQHQVVKDSESSELKQVSSRQKKKRRKPLDRGGRPRNLTEFRNNSPQQQTVPRASKPEIVCWKRLRQWFVGVEAPEEILESADEIEIYQNGVPLPANDDFENRRILNSISGHVLMRWRKGDLFREISATFGPEGYLIFRLSGQNFNQGRLVKSVSSGLYLVIALDTWERDESASGYPRIAPEPAALNGYMAHYFEIEKGTDNAIAFKVPDGLSGHISFRSTQFELVGTLIEDVSENIGPLFNEPPKIRALQPQGWKDISTIVVGEEGSGRGRWRTQFSPETDQMELKLPPQIKDRGGGWYYLRFYDKSYDLIESLDFRFLLGLSQIEISKLFPLPSTDGHKPAHVKIGRNKDIIIRQLESEPSVQAKHEETKTVLTIPPNLSYDTTHWLISYKGQAQVEATILLERIWWGHGEKSPESVEWQDKHLVFSRDQFMPTSEKNIWMHFPIKRWTNRILVGFKRARAKQYPVRVTEKVVAIPLREFADTEEVADRTKEHQLRVWIEQHDGEYEGVIAILPALPTIALPQQWIIGRYKTAIAKVMLLHGSGNFTVNDTAVEDYFKDAPVKAKRFLQRIRHLPEVSGHLSQLDVLAEVVQSDPTTMRQAKAVVHALARAMMKYDPELKFILKKAGFGGVRFP